MMATLDKPKTASQIPSAKTFTSAKDLAVESIAEALATYLEAGELRSLDPKEAAKTIVEVLVKTLEKYAKALSMTNAEITGMVNSNTASAAEFVSGAIDKAREVYVSNRAKRLTKTLRMADVNGVVYAACNDALSQLNIARTCNLALVGQRRSRP